MRNVRLGKTGIVVPQNAFGALPIQRISKKDAIHLLRKAYDNGMTLFDTARDYTDSEEKVGEAFEGIRENVFICTKSHARTPEKMRSELETSLRLLKTDHIDVYQLHQIDQCYYPGDGTGMYEALCDFKKEGKILHFGVTAHKLPVAEEAVESGLYETMQFPFSYLSGPKDEALVRQCQEKDMGFLCMKALSGGLITDYRAAAAFLFQYENVIPIWGIQKERELDEWLSLFDHEIEMTDEIKAIIEKDRKELAGDFCRGCGYCVPTCPAEIEINTCARMSLFLRRAPSQNFLNEAGQAKMQKIENCAECGTCRTKCPYELNVPELLKKNLADYKNVLSGKVSCQ